MGRDPLTLRRAVKFGLAWLIFIGGICEITFLAACAPIPVPFPPVHPWDLPTDQLGNPWPPECRRDLSVDTAAIPIHFAPRANMNGANGWFMTFGSTDSHGVLTGLILIADDLIGVEYADVLHHERSHAVCGLTWHA